MMGMSEMKMKLKEEVMMIMMMMMEEGSSNLGRSSNCQGMGHRIQGNSGFGLNWIVLGRVFYVSSSPLLEIV